MEITRSYPSAKGDPFNNLTMNQTGTLVAVAVHTYEESAEILLSRDQVLNLVSDLNKILDATEPTVKPLGYNRLGEPIHPIQPGLIASAAVVLCSSVGCSAVIRGMGGPLIGATCPTCWEKK